jgi:hypothetical protein
MGEKLLKNKYFTFEGIQQKNRQQLITLWMKTIQLLQVPIPLQFGDFLVRPKLKKR